MSDTLASTAARSSFADPADDWSGTEPEAVRAARQAEFWPQLEATLSRALFLLWGLGFCAVLFFGIIIGWWLLFEHPGASLLVWGTAMVLTVSGAWLSFLTASDLGGELEDSTASDRA